jgi:acetyl-CoA carboxylase biotin carboxylase subunit
MGDKIAAKRAATSAGLPCVPGTEGAVEAEADALAAGKRIGYPILVKAAAGGGGKGMRVAASAEELATAVRTARAEAQANFGNGAVYLEKYLAAPRHIEMQILADHHGGVIHLGERDCSLQRRHQKLLEEAPSPVLDAAARKHIGTLAVEAIKKLGYRNAGTLEFLWADGEFYFIEMNTRLQVEHPVTEEITGIDIVREQIRIAAGLPLSVTQDQVRFTGHAIECRINAEDPQTFAPSPGRVGHYHPPGGPGVRVDSGLFADALVPPHYDSLVAKLIVHGHDRQECVMRLKRALGEYVIDGIKTTLPLHARLMDDPDFAAGRYDVHWLQHFVDGSSDVYVGASPAPHHEDE